MSCVLPVVQRSGDAPTHDAPFLPRPPLTVPVRSRDRCPGPRAMTAQPPPEPLSAEQWESLMPLTDISLDVGAVAQISVEGHLDYLVAVVIDSDHIEATVIPLSDQPKLATEWDLLIDDGP